MSAQFQPGDLVRQFAKLYNLPVAELSILVEGEHDKRYFELASRLYLKETGLRLLGGKLAVFPTGIGEDGGAYGLQRHFHPLRAMMDRDLTAQSKKVFHAVVLFDDDQKGNQGFAAITGQHLNYKKWRDAFLLKRVLPRKTRDFAQIPDLIEEANVNWKGMRCEIEDLVSVGIIKEFISESPKAAYRGLDEQDGGIHCHLTDDGKTKCIRFVEANAIFEDVTSLIEVLKFFRFVLGLNPDGEKP